MISGIDLKQVIKYSVKDDKKDPTIWELGIIPSRQMGGIIAETSKGDYMKQMSCLVKLGLKGWSNFKIGDKPVEFIADDNGLADTILDIIPVAVIVELGTEILNLNKLSADESKN